MDILQLVDTVITSLTSDGERTPASFRFLSLPLEIRLAILTYTDLISSTMVQWRPRTRYARARAPNCTDHGHGPCTCQGGPCYCSGPCVYYAVANIDESWAYRCCNNCKPPDHSGVCYCSAQELKQSSSCTCTFRRHALFRVSSQVRHDALTVYYAYSQIAVTPYNSNSMRIPMQWTGMPSVETSVISPSKIELSLYLSSVTPAALSQIRWLEWILPSARPVYLARNTPAWYDYLDTLLLMQHGMNLSALTITFNISCPTRCEGGRYEYSVPANGDVSMWYKSIVGPVRCLGEAGLRDFFVHIRGPSVDQSKKGFHEATLERLVMGEGYDSSKKKPVERVEKIFEENERYCRYLQAL